MFMGLLKDLQTARNKQTYTERNRETLGRRLQGHMAKDDLADIVHLMYEPEVHIPLFEHAEALGQQPEMDDVLRTRFSLRAADILGDKENQAQLSDVMARFDRTETRENTSQSTRRLADELLLSGRDDTPSVLDKVTERIQNTRQEINDRVDYQKQKVKNVARDMSWSVERRLRPLVDVTHDSVRDMIDGVKTRVQSFKDDYRTRQRSIENAQNWETALDKGVSEEQIKNVIEHADFPEVRYGVMKHATKLFEQDSMTPELATDLFYAYQPHTNAQNKNHERFYNQLESYANSVTQQSMGDTSSVGPDDMPSEFATTLREEAQGAPSAREEAQSAPSAREEAQSANVKPPEQGANVHAPEQGANVKPPEQGANVHAPEQGANVHPPERGASLTPPTMAHVTQKEPANIAASPGNKKDPLFSQYGDSDTVKFENSHTLSRLMARHGLDSLPDLPQTSDEMDIRQAQLLGISGTGDAVWGVPDKGEIKHLSDDELEEAFMDQYGEKIAEQDIPLPEHLSIPPEQESYSFFDQLADEFNAQWDDEDALMHEGVPLPGEESAPPSPDENDVPPLSFDGLDEPYEQVQ